MLRRPKEYVCVECLGEGKQSVDYKKYCGICQGLGYFYNHDRESVRCNGCNGEGFVSVLILKECEYCQGRGTRTWIDFIKRPSTKEKELDICLG